MTMGYHINIISVDTLLSSQDLLDKNFALIFVMPVDSYCSAVVFLTPAVGQFILNTVHSVSLDRSQLNQNSSPTRS